MTSNPTPESALEAMLRGAPPGPLVVLSSGGLDSTCLLHVAATSASARARGLRALHLDHGLHPDSVHWAAHVARLAEALSVPLAIERIEVDRDDPDGLEAAARKARYARVREVLSPGALALAAHHADDQAETLLLRLLRASGTPALAAMRPLRRLGAGWLARPWLLVPRAALLAHAQAHALAWIEDPSNANPAHDRNRLRHEVLSRLDQRWPGAAVQLARSAAHLRGTALIEGETMQRTLARCRGLDPATLDLVALESLPPHDLSMVLKRWLSSLGLPAPRASTLARVRSELISCASDATPRLRWPGAELRRHRGLLYALAPMAAMPSGIELDWDGLAPLELPAGAGVLSLTPPRALALQVRFRAGGERMRMSPGQGERPVKHLLQELGVPPWRREQVPLLHRDGRLVALGDLARTPAFAHELAELGTALAWRQADPVESAAGRSAHAR